MWGVSSAAPVRTFMRGGMRLSTVLSLGRTCLLYTSDAADAGVQHVVVHDAAAFR